MAPAPKIAIVGAGPVGCLLARLLHLASISVVLFEAEASPNYRSQGGTLDLHTSTGLAALKEANLFSEFLKFARYDGHHIQFTDRHLKSYLTLVGPPTPQPEDPSNTQKHRSKISDQRPEIDRSDLRRLLAESLPADIIRWGHKLSHLSSPSPPSSSISESITIHFTNSSLPPASGFSLIVGADGAFSKTRAFLGSQPPVFSRVGYFELSVPDAKATAPELHAVVKGGSILAHATSKRVTVQQMGDGSLSVGVMQAQEESDWMKKEKCGYDSGDLEVVKGKLLEGEDAPFGGDWHPLLKESIAKAEDRCAARSLWQLPVGWRWEHRKGVTLVGDAAHLMTPFAGEGVNVGLEDAMRLARGLVSALKEGEGSEEAFDTAVKEYEEEMWARSEKVSRLSDELARLYMFEKNTPQSVIARTSALHVKFDQPRVVHPVIDVLMHGYFFFKRMTA